MAIDLELVRARNAFEAAQKKAAAPPKERSGFLNLARKLPAMLQTNGLLASCAFLFAKNEPERKAVREACRSHLDHAELASLHAAAAKLDEVFKPSRAAARRPLTGPELQRLTAETIAFAGWLKRAAEATCDTGEEAAP